MNSKDFGRRVAILRKEKGLTQIELAQKLNVSNKAISRWETGEGYPEITILASLARELGVTVDELLSDTLKEEDFEKEGFEKEGFEKSPYHNTNSEHIARKDIPFEKPYWQSLTIFNKIGVASIVINIISLILYGIMLIINLIFNGIPSLLFFIPVFIYGFATFICKVGLISTIIGLIAGLLNLYDRQIKVSVIIMLILLFTTYILPLMVVSTSSLVV